MGNRNKLCPKCKKNTIKNFYAKTCIKCRDVSMENNPRWKGKSRCKKCGKRCAKSSHSNLCWECYSKEHYKGLPLCKICGKKLSRYNSTTNICQECYRGELTTRWNKELTDEERLNGRTVNPDYYQWRKNVFERDDYSCQKCGDNTGGNLIAHHIEGYNKNKKLRVDLDNGVTLCKNCHLEYHRIYGFKDSKRSDFNKFIL